MNNHYASCTLDELLEFQKRLNVEIEVRLQSLPECTETWYQAGVTHCDGTCHGVYSDGSPMAGKG